MVLNLNSSPIVMRYPIYILTLPESSDRQRVILSSLGDAGGKAKFISQTDWYFTVGWRVRASYLDQYRKYVEIFRRIKQAGHPALVLEDDAIALSGWEKALSHAPEDFDFLFLSDDVCRHPLGNKEGPWATCRFSKTTCATVFSPRAAEALLRWRFICKHPMDWTINYLLAARSELNCYWHLPGVFEHGTKRGRYPSTIKPELAFL